MLRGLTERPNVQSTLILSRRDGSIIRATGIKQSEDTRTSISTTPYQWSQAQSSKTDSDVSERGGLSAADVSNEPAETQHSAMPAEVLATSIFQFVNNASGLGATLGATSRRAIRMDGTFAGGAFSDGTRVSRKDQSLDEEAEHGMSEDEVQLLRLRTKYQEIIIFPDSNYICCVVQRVGRAGIAHDKR